MTINQVLAYAEITGVNAQVEQVFAYCEYTGDALAPLESTNIENWDALTPPAITGWSVTQVVNTGTSSTWVSSTSWRKSLPNSVKFNCSVATAGNKSRLVRTAAIDMTTLVPAGYILTFQLVQSTVDSGYADNVQVQVSVDAGVNWIDVGSPIPRYNATTVVTASNSGWMMQTIDLSAYSANASLLIGFLGSSTNNPSNYDIFIDDIKIGRPINYEVEQILAYAEVTGFNAQVEEILAYAEVVFGVDNRPIFGPRWQ